MAVSNLKHQTCSVRGKELAVYRNSEDGDSLNLVMMHGLTSSVDLNEKLKFPDWEHVAEKYPLVKFDVRGHGRSESEHNPENYIWQNLSLDLLELVERLNLKDVVLAGSSMGAATCLTAMSELDKRDINVKGLVLVIPPTYGDERAKLLRIYDKFATILETKGSKSLVEYWESLPPTEFFARELPETREISHGHFVEHADSLSMAAAFRGSAMCKYPSVEAIQSISAPVLILSRVDDPTHPVESAEYLDKHLPRSVHHCATTKEDVYGWPELVLQFMDNL